MASTRNAINVLIRLLGGAEMTAELKTLGTSGEAAIKKIDAAAKGVSLANLGNAVNAFGKDLATVASRTALAISGIAAGVSAVAPVILLLAKSGAEAADAAGKAAEAAGLQADAYQKLAFAAGEADVSQEQFSTAMNSFSKQVTKTADETVKGAGKIGSSLGQAGRDIVQGIGSTTETFKDIGVQVTRFGDSASKAGTKAQTGAKKITTGFDDLGIKVKNANGTLKTNEQLLLEVANAFQKLPDGARKSAISIKLFGEEGTKLIPFLDQGAAGIRALMDEADRLGIVFSDEQIKAAEAFNTALGDLKKTTAGVLRQIGLIFAPAFTAGANAFKDAIVRNRVAILDFVKNGVQTATVFIKDFFAVLSGRDSAVTDNKWLISWRDNIVGFGQDFANVATGVVIPAMAKLRAAADATIKVVNGIFGTNITTGEVLIGAAIVKMIGGFGLLRSAIILCVEAIAFLSRAALLTPLGRAIIIVAAALEGAIKLFDLERSKQQAWIAGTDAHKNALNELRAAIDAVKAGVPGAEENLKRLAQAHLDSAKAALADAKAQVDQQQQIVDAMKAGGDFAAPLGADIDTQTEALVRANINLAKHTRELDEIQKTLDGKAVGNIEDLRTKADAGAAGVKNAATSVKDLGTEADTAAGKVENLNHQITVTRGGGPGGQLSKEVFDVVDGVARRADQSKEALDGVAVSAQAAGDHVRTVASEVANSVNAVPDAIKSDAASRAVDSVVADVNKIKPAADEAAAGLKDALNPSDDVGGGLSSAIGTAVDGVITDVQKMPAATQEAVAGVNSAIAGIDPSGAAQAAAAISGPFTALPSIFSQIFSGLGALIQGGFSNLSSVVASLASQIRAQIASILSALREAAAAAASLRAQAASSSSSSSGGGSQGGFREGGHLGTGPGTSTSDSIPIWASLGEFITQAKAVAYYGVDVFHAFNRMLLPRDFLKGLRGFKFGGTIDGFQRSLAVPRMAGGGRVAFAAAAGNPSEGRTPFVLQLPGGEQIDDLTIGNIALNRLQKFAISSSLTSTGRKPLRGK